jgi:L-lactate dehydrogenase (cytochrome)
MEVYVDGGIRRGTDILKALALGATAVGVGRPYLYSLTYGQDGVEHLTQSTCLPLVSMFMLTSAVLKDELISAMKLSGITHIDQAHPGMVNTAYVDHLVRATETHPWITWTPRAKI